MKRYVREPVNFITHLIPALLAIPATNVLWEHALVPIQKFAAFTFGSGAFMVFLVSSLYHSVPKSPRALNLWQKADHCSIYVMIAGSYTPTLLLIFDGLLKWILFAAIWVLALIGCLLKIANRFMSKNKAVSLYISMGCLILPLLHQMSVRLPYMALVWLMLGGFLYVIGTIFYKQDRHLNLYVHTHEIWHMFVVGGAVSHYIYNLFYVFPPL